MKFVLIRHTAVDMPKGICYGQTDVPLKSTFPIEAMVISRELSKYNFDAAYTSPLSRCTRLAEACGFADAIQDERLMELNFGKYELVPFEDFDVDIMRQWSEDYMHLRFEGGESFTDQHARFVQFVDDVKQKGYDTVAVFTHGGILMQAMLISGRSTVEELYANQPPYGGILEFEI